MFLQVEVALDLPEYEPNFDFKRRALYSMGMHSNKRFKLRKNEIPFEVPSSVSSIRLVTFGIRRL